MTATHVRLVCSMTIAGVSHEVSIAPDLKTWERASDGYTKAQARLITYFILPQLVNPPKSLRIPGLGWKDITITEIERFSKRPRKKVRHPRRVRLGPAEPWSPTGNPSVTVDGNPQCRCDQPGRRCPDHDP